MLVDPFTVVAQIVNFALLIWLLRRILYGPITRAMEAREARIREELESARRLRSEAAAEGERYRELVAGIETEREVRLAEVRTEIDALRHEQMQQARAEVRALRERWSHALEREQEAFLRDLRLELGRGSVEVIRNALRDLADVDLEDRIVTRFVDRIGEMADADRQRLASAARREEEGFRFRTAFPLTDAHRETLARAVTETFGVEGEPQFETDPGLVAGIELRAGGVKLAWTIDDYLRTLEEEMRVAFEETVSVGVGERADAEPDADPGAGAGTGAEPTRGAELDSQSASTAGSNSFSAPGDQPASAARLDASTNPESAMYPGDGSDPDARANPDSVPSPGGGSDPDVRADSSRSSSPGQRPSSSPHRSSGSASSAGRGLTADSTVVSDSSSTPDTRSGEGDGVR